MAINQIVKKCDNIVIIFSKRPRYGEIKKRIAEETSEQFAFDFANACIKDLLNNICNSESYDIIVGTENENDLKWFKNNHLLEGIMTSIPNKLYIDKNECSILSIKFDNVFNILLNYHVFSDCS